MRLLVLVCSVHKHKISMLIFSPQWGMMAFNKMLLCILRPFPLTRKKHANSSCKKEKLHHKFKKIFCFSHKKRPFQHAPEGKKSSAYLRICFMLNGKKEISLLSTDPHRGYLFFTQKLNVCNNDVYIILRKIEMPSI